MSKRTFPALRPRQRLAICYAAAAVLWALWCLVGSGVMLNYKLGGHMPAQTLHLADMQLESLVPYPAGGGGWYVSSDADPHLLLPAEGYVETVELHAQYKLPGNGVALYYRRPGQADYSERQKVFARLDADGVFRFDLGGRVVSGLRIDPDSLGGVPILVESVVINPTRPWYLRLVPGAGAWLVLLFAPALAAALWQLLRGPAA